MTLDEVLNLEIGDWVKCTNVNVKCYGDLFRVTSHDLRDRFLKEVRVCVDGEDHALFYDTLEESYEIYGRKGAHMNVEFKLGDWVKCVDPNNRLYGKIFEVVSKREHLFDNIRYTIQLLCGSSFERYFVTEEGINLFTLTPAPNTWECNYPTQEQKKQTFTAPDILRKAEEIMRERGKQYDQQGGERSMEKIVNTFNAATGHNLTEAQGWMFMIFLKLVRDNSRTEGHQDSCEDLVAYSSLYGESRLS